MNSLLPQDLVPNYARYPNDTLGVSSALWNNSMNGLMNVGGEASFNDYLDVTNFGSGQDNDGLAFPGQIQGVGANAAQLFSFMRPYEIAAVAPDLFDITYYSIQPNFPQRYLSTLISDAQKGLLASSGTALTPFADMGSRASVPALGYFSAIDQINVANGTEDAMNPGQQPTGGGSLSPGSIVSPVAFWHVTSPANLLTSWVGNDAYADYTTFPSGRFGQCGTPAYNAQGVGGQFHSPVALGAPGACIMDGGRAGYSVKLVSKQMLTNSNIPIGGSQGSIQNQPQF